MKFLVLILISIISYPAYSTTVNGQESSPVKEFILTIVITPGTTNNRVATTTVPGFTSLKNCNTAGYVIASSYEKLWKPRVGLDLPKVLRDCVEIVK